MKLFFSRQLKKLTLRAEIQVLIAELDIERRRIKRKMGEIKCARIPSHKSDLDFLRRNLDALSVIRGHCVTKIVEIKTQEKINNNLSYNTSYAETFLQVATSVLNKKTFNKIQTIALERRGDSSLVTKTLSEKESQSPQPGNTQTLSLPESMRKLKK